MREPVDMAHGQTKNKGEKANLRHECRQFVDNLGKGAKHSPV